MNKNETFPTTVEEALEMMRFGCPFQVPMGDYDVKYFERRMLRAAEILEVEVIKLKNYMNRKPRVRFI